MQILHFTFDSVIDIFFRQKLLEFVIRFGTRKSRKKRIVSKLIAEIVLFRKQLYVTRISCHPKGNVVFGAQGFA